MRSLRRAEPTCTEVVTETRRGRQHAATSWKLSQRTRAPWSWIEPPHLLERDGTAVLLRLTNPLSPLLDPGFVEETVLRQYQPLFEPEFLDILGDAYPDGVAFRINDGVVIGPIRPALRHPNPIRVGRQRKPSGVGYIARHAEPLPEPERGLAISTLGKVIRLGLAGAHPTGARPPLRARRDTTSRSPSRPRSRRSRSSPRRRNTSSTGSSRAGVRPNRARNGALRRNAPPHVT